MMNGAMRPLPRTALRMSLRFRQQLKSLNDMPPLQMFLVTLNHSEPAFQNLRFIATVTEAFLVTLVPSLCGKRKKTGMAGSHGIKPHIRSSAASIA